jgi:uncharacterized protein YjiS (DUF1127 family)
MTTLLKTTIGSRSGSATLIEAARVVARVFAAGWTAMNNRRKVTQLQDLDDYMLADIGLTRADLREAVSLPLHQDPSLRLAVLVNEHQRQTTRSQIRGLRGDSAAPPVRRAQ